MFHSARIRLTLWYLLILIVVTTAFSLVIYRMLTLEVDRLTRVQRYRVERVNNELRIVPDTSLKPQSKNPMFHPQIIEETKKRIAVILALTDGAVLILSGGLAYLLAGRTLKPIKEMVEEQNQFISDASHELRTPLTSLKSAFEVYLRGKNPTLKEARSIMQESVVEVNKMQALSDTLLQLAQYQKPNGHTQFENVSIKSVLLEATKKLKLVAAQKQINLRQEGKDIVTFGNKDSLVDIFVILLDNAIKYSPEKSEVVIKTEKKGNAAVISVIDKGIGIEKKDMGHIFDRFYRGDQARSKAKSGGYGLGLSIAVKILEVHNGKIQVESRKNNGSTFRVYLPALTDKIKVEAKDKT